MALDDIAVELGRVARRHVLRHAEPRLHRHHVGLVDLLDEVALGAHARGPAAAAAAGRALVNDHSLAVRPARGGGSERARRCGEKERRLTT